MKNKNLEKKLATYSALSLGLLSFGNLGYSQIVYNDVTPDETVGDTSSYLFDVNLDGYPDIEVIQGIGFDSSQNRIIDVVVFGNYNNVEILGSTYGNYFYPAALDYNDVIDGNQTGWKNVDYGTFNYQNTAGASYGNWIGVQDKFVGLKLNFGTTTQYGWIRLDVSADAKTFVVKDYAFNAHDKKAIYAGSDLNQQVVKNLKVLDIADNLDASDFEISFDKAKDETNLTEYRVFIIPFEQSYDFTLDTATIASSSSYIQVAKTGADLKFKLSSNQTDYNGDPIKIATYYRVYVLSVADGVNVAENTMSTSNQGIAILHVNSSPATDVTASDVGNNGNGSDLRISFTKAADEDKVDEYWVFVMPSPDAVTFDIGRAAQVNVTNATRVAKIGSDISLTLNENSKDIYGNLIKENFAYKVIVASLADGINSSLHVLSDPSNEIILTNTNSVSEISNDINFDIVTDQENITLVFHESYKSKSISIYDLNGKFLSTLETSQDLVKINRSNYSKGTYILKVNEGSQLKTTKIFID